MEVVKEGGAGEGGAEGGAEGGGGVRKNSMTSLMPRIARLVHRPPAGLSWKLFA